MLHPVHLSVLAGIAFFHALMFMRGPKRIALCALAFVTLVLTYARSELMVFLAVLTIYTLVLSKNVLLRWSGILTAGGIVALAITFQEKVLQYMERGQGARNITTLSERTLVWEASFKAIALRPYIGYGFIAGPKNALRDHWNSTNWVPPHSHSEFIQAVLSGGYIAGALIIAIYGRAMWSAVRGAINGGLKQIFLLIVLVQITLMALIMPLVSLQYSKISGIFLVAFVGVVAGERKRVQHRARRVARTTESVPAFGWAKQS